MLSDIKKIFSQSVIYGIGTMAPKLAGLILIPLYTRNFSVGEFGVIGLMDSAAQILIGILGFALYQGFFRWYFDQQIIPYRKSLFFTLLIVHIGIAAISLAIILPFTNQISIWIFSHTGYDYVIKVMLIASMLQMVVTMPSTLLRVQEKSILYSTANIVQMIVIIIVSYVLIVHVKQGVEAIFHAQFVGLIVYVLMMSKTIRENITFRMEWRMMYDLAQFCMPLVLSTIAVVLLNQADRFIIKSFGELGDVGLYTIGFRLSNTLNIILVASISFAIQPMIFQKMDDPDNKRFYSKLMTYFVFVVMFFVLGMAFFGKEIVKLFARREEYYEAYKYIPLLSLAILFNMIKDMAMIGLQITKKTSVMAIIIVIVSATGILFNFMLIPSFSNFGAAFARLAAAILFLLLVYHFAQKAYFIPYEVMKISKMILVGAALYVPVYFIEEETAIIRIMVKSSLIMLYPFILYGLGFYEAAELNSMRGAWNKWKNLKELKGNIKRLFH